MEAYREAVAAAEAERDRRKAMTTNRRGEFKDPKTVKGATWVPETTRRRAHYQTRINDIPTTINLYSFSDVEKDTAIQLYWAFQHAKPTSLTNQKKRKAEREAVNATSVPRI